MFMIFVAIIVALLVLQYRSVAAETEQQERAQRNRDMDELRERFEASPWRNV